MKENKDINRYLENFIQKQELDLDCGLKIICLKRPKFKCFDVNLSIGFGVFDHNIKCNDSIIEIKSGIAHYIEHILFNYKKKGNKNPIDVSKEFANMSLVCNAYTAFDHTSFTFTGTKNFDKGLKLLLDFVLNPTFSNAVIEKEKGIIIQELMMYEDDFEDKINSNIFSSTLTDIPFKEDIGGSVDDVKNCTKEDIIEAYNYFYKMSNMVLFVCGDFDISYIKGLVIDSIKDRVSVKREDVERPSLVFHEQDDVKEKMKKINLNSLIPTSIVSLKLHSFFDEDKNRRRVERYALTLLFEYQFGLLSNTYQDMLDNFLITSNYSSNVEGGAYTYCYTLRADTYKPLEFANFIKDKFLSISEVSINQATFDVYKKALIS